MTHSNSESGTTSNARIWLLPGLVVAGLLAGYFSPLETADVLDWGRRLAGNPLFLAVAVAVMAGLMTFGLPGTLFVWLIAPFQSPWLAVPLLLIGSVGGALGAYAVGSKIRRGWRPSGLGRRVIKLLEKRGDIVTQCALRILPGFPHSVVNFAGGLIPLPLGGFIGAAVVGLAIKWGVYAVALHGAADALESGEGLQPRTIVPLVVLTLLLLVGAWASGYVRRHFNGNGE